MRILLRNALLCAVLLAGCESQTVPPPSSGLTAEQFIELFVAVRNAQNTARTPEELETMKRAIFQRAGLPPESLTQFVSEHGTDVSYMATVWDSIKNRLDVAAGPTPR